jgi:four helix bundle protein
MENSKFALDHFELYQLARAFRQRVYRILKELPHEEKYCLVPQMRRAALSVSNNVAEGHGRWHYLENIRFCQIARGSIEEVIDDLNVCLDETYAARDAVVSAKSEAYELIRRLNGYVAYLRKSKQGIDTNEL